MALAPGTILASFEVSDLIGAGAMGEVYRARDSKLGREVAIKVLPDNFATDHERLARFEREARLLASLNHPNIAGIHELGSDGDTHFLVMELVEGQTLSEKLQNGPLPIEQTLPLFAQIAEALENAHEQGIVHRDLKPANIKVTDEGMVKVLDFGLAKALVDPRASQSGPGETEAFDSGSVSVTGDGRVLGTPAYMAPEQASGEKLDKRADIWAFGCCLYEALAGKRPFVGDNATQLLARILEREPDWETLPTTMPTRVRVLIWRCLQKSPQRRLRDIGEARFELSETATDPSGKFPALGPTIPPSPSGLPRLVMGIALGVVLGSAAAAIFFRMGTVPGPVPSTGPPLAQEKLVFRSTYDVSDDRVRGIYPLGALCDRSSAIAISSDGLQIAYVANLGGSTQLYVRELASFEATPISGSEGAYLPFFSPDGASLAFFTQDQLKTVSLRGGSPVALCEARNSVGGCWDEDGVIYFGEKEGTRLSSIKATGGAKDTLLDRALPLWRPFLLPNGKGLLFTGLFDTTESSSLDYGKLLHLPFGSDEPRVLYEGGLGAAYVDTGHLVFMRGDSLMAVEFDLDELTTGDRAAVAVVEGVVNPKFAVSPRGHLVYVAGYDNFQSVPTWIDREGNLEPLSIPARDYGTFDLSPDNRRLAIQINGVRDHIQIHDIDTGRGRRFAVSDANRFPIWTPNGERLVFWWLRSENAGLALKEVATSEPPELLIPVAVDGFAAPSSFLPDGSALAYTHHETISDDVSVLSLTQPRKSLEFAADEFSEWSPAFSPDGKWLAYTSDQDGQYQVYVRPYPRTSERIWKVSDKLGEEPIWSPAGGELFYRSGTRFMSVRYRSEPDFLPEPPEVAFEGPFVNIVGLSYDVSKDGQRLLVLKPTFDDMLITELRIVRNWSVELSRIVPTSIRQ